jgi:hypothetical protein
MHNAFADLFAAAHGRFCRLSRRGHQVSPTNLAFSANSLLSLAATSNQAARGMIRGSGIQTKILGIVAVLAAVALRATGIGVSAIRSYHNQVAAMTQPSARALLGEQIDKLVTAVVMDSRGIYMSADKDEA